MAERKLRLAVPKGKLSDPNNWSVRNILELARIGQYSRDGKKFISFDSDIEARVMWPRDMPFLLVYNPHYHGAIISRNLVDEVKFRERDQVYTRIEEDYIEEVKDLGCGYVDLAFITSSEMWKKVRGNLKSSGKNVSNLTNLELFLQYGFIYDEKVRRIITKYPSLAQEEIRRARERFSTKTGVEERDLQFRVIGIKGVSEDFLLDGTANLIFESVATGDAMRKRKLVLLDTVSSSTARLFSNRYNKKEERNKINKIAGRIEDVLKDIDNYCQIRFEIPLQQLRRAGNINPKYFDTGSAFFDPAIILGRFGHEIVSYVAHFDRSLETFLVDIVINKGDLHKIKEFLYQRGYNQGFELFKDLGIEFRYKRSADKKAKMTGLYVYELKSPYAYCPLVECVEAIDLSGKYPCCDVSKLRLEHRADALMFSFDEKGTYVNPRYQNLFR